MNGNDKDLEFLWKSRRMADVRKKTDYESQRDAAVDEMCPHVGIQILESDFIYDSSYKRPDGFYVSFHF